MTAPAPEPTPRLTDEEIRFAATLLRPYRHLLTEQVRASAPSRKGGAA